MVEKSYNAHDVFQLETCRALVALADADRSGRLNLEEFKGYTFFAFEIMIFFSRNLAER